MSGSLNVGTLYVRVAADVGEFTKGMTGVAETVEKTAKRVKRLANEIGHIGLGLGASLAVAVHEAAKFDSGIHAALDKIKHEFETLAITVARVAMPTLKAIADIIGNVTRFLRQLSPETQASIATFIRIGIEVGVAALAIGKLAGIIHAFAGIFAILGGALGGWFLPIIIGAGLAIIAIGALYNFWTDANSRVGQGMHQTASIMVTLFKVATTQIRTEWNLLFEGIEAVLKGIGAEIQQVLILAAQAAKFVGKDELSQQLTVAGGMFHPEAIVENLKNAVTSGVSALPGLVADGVKGALKFSIEGYKKMLSDAAGSLGVKLGGGATGEHPLTPHERILNFNTGFGQTDKSGEDIYSKQVEADAAGETEFRHVQDLIRSLDPVQSAAVRFARDIRNMGDVSEDFVNKIVSASDAMRDKVAGRTGKIAGVVESGVQGMAVGGPVGAAVGIGVDLLSQSKQFAYLFATVDTFLQALADGLGALLEPILPLLDILSPLATVVGELASMISAILQPAFSFLWNGALKPLAQLVLLIAGAIGEAWNAVLGAIQGFLRNIGLKGAADALDANKINTKGIWDGLDSLGKATYDTSLKTHKLGMAADAATEALSNVPQGFKVALARFNAADPESGASTGGGQVVSGGGSGGSASSPPSGPTGGGSGGSGGGSGGHGGGSGGPHVVMNISGAGDPLAVARAVADRIKGINFRGSRTPSKLSPRLA